MTKKKMDQDEQGYMPRVDMSADVFPDRTEGEAHMFFDRRRRESQLEGNCRMRHTFLIVKLVYLFLLWGEVGDSVFDKDIISLYGAHRTFFTVLLVFLLVCPFIVPYFFPGDLFQAVKSPVTGHDEQIGFKVLDLLEGGAVFPYFEKDILYDLLGKGEGIGKFQYIDP